MSAATRTTSASSTGMESTTMEHACSLLPVPAAAGVARRLARAFLAEWDLFDGAGDDIVLVVSELVTNALLHALPPADLRLSWTWLEDGCRVVRVEVSDSGAAVGVALPTPRAADEDLDEIQEIDDFERGENGRGIDIVAALSARHGTWHDGAGRVTHWADVRAM